MKLETTPETEQEAEKFWKWRCNKWMEYRRRIPPNWEKFGMTIGQMDFPKRIVDEEPKIYSELEVGLLLRRLGDWVNPCRWRIRVPNHLLLIPRYRLKTTADPEETKVVIIYYVYCCAEHKVVGKIQVPLTYSDLIYRNYDRHNKVEEEIIDVVRRQAWEELDEGSEEFLNEKAH